MTDTALRKRLAQAAGYRVQEREFFGKPRFDVLLPDGTHMLENNFFHVSGATEEAAWAQVPSFDTDTDAALQLAWNILPPDYGIYLEMCGNATTVKLREDEDGRGRAREQAEGEYHTPRAICLALASWLDWLDTPPDTFDHIPF